MADKALRKAHAAAARRAARARGDALRSGAPTAPVVVTGWARQMQDCADAAAVAEKTGAVDDWRSAAAAADALWTAVGAGDDGEDDAETRSARAAHLQLAARRKQSSSLAERRIARNRLAQHRRVSRRRGTPRRRSNRRVDDAARFDLETQV